MFYTRHGVPTEGSPPDHKCKLNISSFLTLPHTLHCHITLSHLYQEYHDHCFAANDGGMGRLRDGSFMFGLGGRTGGGGHIFLLSLLSVFVLLLVFSWLIHDSCCVCFIARFLLSLSLVPLIMHY